MVSKKPLKSFFWTAAFLFLITYLIYQAFCGNLPPKAYVGSMEANHPWLMIDLPVGQDVVSPFGDKTDPTILYLSFVDTVGDAIKVDLMAKSITSYRFPVSRREDIRNMAQLWKLSDFGSTRTEFRGVQVTRRVSHMFG